MHWSWFSFLCGIVAYPVVAIIGPVLTDLAKAKLKAWFA